MYFFYRRGDFNPPNIPRTYNYLVHDRRIKGGSIRLSLEHQSRGTNFSVIAFDFSTILKNHFFLPQNLQKELFLKRRIF